MRRLLLTGLLLWQATVFASDQNENLQSAIDKLLIQNHTPGAVVLMGKANDENVVYTAGLANIATKVPVSPTQPFRIASMSKTFLAVTVLKLVESGVIDLDAPAKNYFPDSIKVSHLPNGSTVTVRQLLQMHSGIPNYTEYDAYAKEIAKGTQIWTPEKCFGYIYDQKPNAKPGAEYEYSNTNFLLLQRIVEHVTKQPFAISLKHHIFDPLNLKSTYVENPNQRQASFTTHGYSEEGGQLSDVSTVNDGFGLADGGIITTAQDLNAFIQALLRKKNLISETALKQMLATQDTYGLGIFATKVGDQLALSHSGTASGFSGQYYYFPKTQISLIILTNLESSDAIDGIAEVVLDNA